MLKLRTKRQKVSIKFISMFKTLYNIKKNEQGEV